MVLGCASGKVKSAKKRSWGGKEKKISHVTSALKSQHYVSCVLEIDWYLKVVLRKTVGDQRFNGFFRL